jgi:hypothetical protein
VSEIQPADPQARRTALTILAVVTLIGVILIAAAGQLRAAAEAWVERDLATRARMVIGAMTVLAVGPLLVLAAYSWRLGGRILRGGRYPPPGVRVVRDTPVVTGDAAVRMARGVRVLAALVCASGVLLAYLIWRLVAMLEGGMAAR